MIRKLLAAFLVATIFSGPSPAATTTQRTATTPTIPRSATAPAFQRQMGKMTPTTTYYKGFIPFYDGDYATALKDVSVGVARFDQDDAIALDRLDLLRDDVRRVLLSDGRVRSSDVPLFQRPATLQAIPRLDDEGAVRGGDPSRPGRGAEGRPLGASTRGAKLGHYRENESILQSFTDTAMSAKVGNMVQQPFAYPITPHEIIRCTTLALRRRAELLGPVAKYDQLSSDVAAAFSRPVGLPNHWSGAWIDAEHGLALLASGRDQQAIPYLRRAELAGGEFDHPMTCVVLLELGRLALKSGEYAAAAKLFDEATYAAVNSYSSYPWFPDYGVLEEAFRYGTITHLMANRKGLFPPLETAVQWANKAPRQLRASLLLCAAENYAVLGETRKAAAMLDEARFTIAKRKMGVGQIGARYNYLKALVACQQKQVSESNTALSAAMDYMRHGSLWLFQIDLADRLFVNGDVTPRAALDLFADVLRDPLPFDWGFNPMEALAALSTPQPAAMDHWFEATIERQGIRDVQTSIEVAERTRRRRFFNSLELGGRLESLRWILEAPPARLSQQATLERQDILARYPEYDRLSRKSQAIREALDKLPLVPEDQKAAKQQANQLADLAAISAEQERILREIALRREPSELVFPPLRSLADVQKSLPKKHAVLAFFASKGRLYGFLLDSERCKSWRVASAAALQRQMQALFRDMGQFGQNYELTVKDLCDEKWRQSGKQVLTTLLKDSPADFSQTFDELIVVPDGILWYLPFEVLQVTVDGQPQSLISRFHIRYAPTLSLCISQEPARTPRGNTAVVLGKSYSREGNNPAKAAFEQLSGIVPNAVALHPPAPAVSSVYGALFHRLIVFDDLVLSDQDPYGWVLAPLDKSKSGGTLADWLALPWGGPELVILPGFHTAAEDGLKRPHHGAPGNEVFLSVCGLMANGARTVLLSRWRTGGQTSFDLVREFVQELPNSSPSDAWQRAVLLAMDSRANLGGEPRVKRSPADEAPKANHPFFWAGYMLVDSGAAVEKTESPDEPVIKIKPPKPPEKAAAKDKPKTEKKDKPKKQPKNKPKDEAKEE